MPVGDAAAAAAAACADDHSGKEKRNNSPCFSEGAGDVDTVRRRGLWTRRLHGQWRGVFFLAALGVRVSWSAMALVMAASTLLNRHRPALATSWRAVGGSDFKTSRSYTFTEDNRISHQLRLVVVVLTHLVLR